MELRWPSPRGWMDRTFFAEDATTGAARRIIRMASKTDVYVGVALRDRPTDGGKDAISGSRLLYIECDDPARSRTSRSSRTRRRWRSPRAPPTTYISTGV